MTEYYYNKALAEEPITWIETFCKHYIGEKKGQPLLLDDWQKDILRNLFGWRVVGNDKYFKHSTLWVEIPRGNGKSTFATAVGLYIAFGMGLNSSRVFCFASSKDQSLESVFKPAKYMAEVMNEDHEAGFKLYHSHVEDPETDSTFKLMSADWRGAHSLVGSAFIVDEIHLHIDGKLFGGITSGDAKRTDITPMTLIFTTAGEQDTFGHQQHEYAKAVLNGMVQDDSYLAYIWTAGEQPKDDPEYYFKESTWKVANPGMGFINKLKFSQKAKRAQNSKVYLNDYLRYNLNVWVGSASTFIPAYEWDQCNTGVVPWEELEGYQCYCGLYMMSVRDLIAMSLFFPAQGLLKRFFWCPRAKLEEREIVHPAFSQWINEGYIDVVEGDANDFVAPLAKIEELVAKYRIMAFEYKSREVYFIDRLQRFGVPINPYTLTVGKISAPTMKLEELVLNRELNHEGHPVSDYMMRKVAVISKGDDVKISPEKSAENVCGPIADVLAIAGWMNAEDIGATYTEGVTYFEV